MNNIKIKFLKIINRLWIQSKSFLRRNKHAKVGLLVCSIFIGIYVISKVSESRMVIHKTNSEPNFENGRLMDNAKDTYLKSKGRVLVKKTAELLRSQKLLLDKLSNIEKKVAVIELNAANIKSNSAKVVGSENKGVIDREPNNESLKYHPSDNNLQQNKVGSKISNSIGGFNRPKTRRSSGPTIISFPVKQKRKKEGIVLPTGSYVKAKLMTGIDAPEGKTYPVLLALDYSYIGPNKHRVDLSGCFMIAKSSPSMATERINFQATKLSCVSKNGKFFERKISGFIADDKDNSFAVKAELNSKQGRVAKFAFLKSVVDGIGEIITRKSQNIGGKNPDAAGVTIQNGAQGAAEKVSDWYLKQAMALLPTLSVSSGQDIWVVMQEKVILPNDFFRKNERRNKNAKVYTYFDRVIE